MNSQHPPDPATGDSESPAPRHRTLRLTRTDMSLTSLHTAISFGLSVFAFLIAGFFGVKSIPGGPFISFRGDILPHFFTCAALIFSLIRYKPSSTPRRLLALFAAGLALLVSTLTALGTYSFFHDPYARGQFFCW